MAENGATRLHESSLGHILVGLFVLVVSVGFGWLLMELRSGPERYALVAEFDALGNISEATKVKLRGYTVGQVDDIQFRPSPAPGEPFFLVEIGVELGVPVPAGTVAEIRGSGLVGEAFIELVTPDHGLGQPLRPGSHLSGQTDAGMKTLISRLTEAATKLGGAGASLRDAEIGDKLAQLNRDVSRIADQLVTVGNSADSLLLASRSVVTDLQPALVSSLENLQRSMAQVAVILSRTDTLLTSTDDDVRQTVAALQSVAEHLDAVLGRVDSLMVRKEGQVDSTLSNLHRTSESIRELADHPWKAVTGTAERAPRRDEFDAITGRADSKEGTPDSIGVSP